MLTVHRSKVRPCIVVALAGATVPRAIRGATKWQTAPCLLLLPGYGVENTEKRAGFPAQLIDRIKTCEYPQYLLDELPIARNGERSVLRFDHILPAGDHHDAVEPTEHCLSDSALVILDEWLQWHLTGELPDESFLAQVRSELMA